MIARRLLLCTAFGLGLASAAHAQDAPSPSGPLIVPGDPSDLPDVVRALELQIGPDGEPRLVLGPPRRLDGRPLEDDVWGEAATDDQGRSAYGLFLSGRVAAAQGDAETGARLLRGAYELTPDQAMVRDQAFSTNLLGGDLAFAGRTAPDGSDAPPLVREAGRLVVAVETYAGGDARAALGQLAAQPIGRPHQRAGRLITPWIAAAAGDWTTALAPAREGRDAEAAFARAHRARLLERRGRHAEAEAEWTQVTGSPLGRRLFGHEHGAFLERRGRRGEAVALYDALIAETPDDARLVQSRDRAARRGRPPAQVELRQGAADAMTAAAAIAAAENSHELAAVYLRLSQRLSPSDVTLLNLGEALIEAGLTGPGRATLERIAPRDPAVYASAQLAVADSLEEEGLGEEALAPLRRAVEAAPDAPGPALALGVGLNRLHRWDEALVALASPALAGEAETVTVLYQRALALHGLGRSEEAAAALETALALEPESVEVMTFLGYLWVDGGRRVDEGAELIARAAAGADEGADVQDSLGWARFAQGRYDEAVPLLEAAVELQPSSPVVNDHLGDAYWRVGRRREARFQWNRALTLSPPAALRAELERKLAEGLPDPAGG